MRIVAESRESVMVSEGTSNDYRAAEPRAVNPASYYYSEPAAVEPEMAVVIRAIVPISVSIAKPDTSIYAIASRRAVGITIAGFKAPVGTIVLVQAPVMAITVIAAIGVAITVIQRTAHGIRLDEHHRGNRQYCNCNLCFHNKSPR